MFKRILTLIIFFSLTFINAQETSLPYVILNNAPKTARVLPPVIQRSATFHSQKRAGSNSGFAVVVDETYRRIYIIDTQTNALSGPFLEGQLGHSGELLDVVITPDKSLALVSNFSEKKVFFVDISDLTNPTVTDSVIIDNYVEDLDVTPDGKFAVATDGGGNTLVTSIDIQKATIADTLNLTTNEAQAIAIAPDGQNVLIVDYNNDQILPLLIDPVTGHLSYGTSPTINMNNGPINITFSPDGKYALVATIRANQIQVLEIRDVDNIAYRYALDNVPGPQSIIFSQDGTMVYAVCTNSSPDSLLEYQIDNYGNLSPTGKGEQLMSDGGGGFYGVDVAAVSEDNNYIYVGAPTSVDLTDIQVVDRSTVTLYTTLNITGRPVGIYTGTNTNYSGGINLTFNQIDASGFPIIDNYVTVTDNSGNSITGLTDSNFVVWEDGYEESPVTVTELAGTKNPISVSLVIDRSGSMTGQPLADAKTAAKDFVDDMEGNDEAAVISFSTDVTVDQQFTTDKDSLKQAIDALIASGNTSIYDASIEAVNLTSAQNGRKAVILMTDGTDNSSVHTLQNAIDEANNANIPIYTIGLGLTPGSVEEQNLMRLADETGGNYHYAPNSSDLDELYKQISEQLKNQYKITYETHNQKTDGSVRTVEVSVQSNGQTDNKDKTYTAPQINAYPVITSIIDVPYDQGGKVWISWRASGYDYTAAVKPILFYSIWRAIPGNPPTDTPVRKNGRKTIRTTVLGDTTQYWEWVADQPAHNLPRYGYACATLYDSISSTNGMHRFFISAHAADEFYDSDPVSGYSVDNLAPNSPDNLLVTINAADKEVTLNWAENSEQDFYIYNVYRKEKGNSTWHLRGKTETTEFTDNIDNNPKGYMFAVTAVDKHENESARSDSVYAVITALGSEDNNLPLSFNLEQNYPNPFNPVTTIYFNLPNTENVYLAVYNNAGSLIKVLTNKTMRAGRHNVNWDGTNLYGKPVASGIYLYKIVAGHFKMTRKMILMR